MHYSLLTQVTTSLSYHSQHSEENIFILENLYPSGLGLHFLKECWAWAKPLWAILTRVGLGPVPKKSGWAWIFLSLSHEHPYLGSRTWSRYYFSFLLDGLSVVPMNIPTWEAELGLGITSLPSWMVFLLFASQYMPIMLFCFY